jgi:hypothetical protein
MAIYFFINYLLEVIYDKIEEVPDPAKISISGIITMISIGFILT